MNRLAYRRTTGIAGTVLLLMSLVVALGLPAAGTPGGDPPGNNGTVKIDGVEFDTHPDNEPHVGCVFQVDFYGYDEGDLWADVTFAVQPPTGGFVTIKTDTVDIGQDPAGGGTDLDHQATYDLTSVLASYEQHPQQGWHVKLTVNADGSIGNDVKHKVFWVTGCDDEEGPDDADVLVSGSCVEDDFVVTYSTVNASIVFTVGGTPIVVTSGQPVGQPVGTVISWTATADADAEFSPDVDEMSGTVTVLDCDDVDLPASVSVSGSCVEDDFVVTYSTVNASIVFTVGGTPIVVTSGQPVGQPVGTVISWTATADADAEFAPDVDEMSGTVTVLDCDDSTTPRVRVRVRVQVQVQVQVLGPARETVTPPIPFDVVPETEVLGIQVSAPEAAQVSQAQVATQETLPFTGVSTSSMALLAIALAGIGVLLLMASRKAEDERTPARNWN